MKIDLSYIDIAVFIFYCILVIAVGFFVARKKKGAERTTSEYFLAGKTLPWWAVGASLIAANISAEQFIGMSGSGYQIGLAMASYEWIAALTLIIVGKFFLPVFIKNNIFTMPQFLEKRFDKRVKTVLAVFWLLLYVFINLTSVLYLGALFMNTVLGIDLLLGIIILASFTAIYSIYGGLMSVAWTDVIHVIFLVLGGILTTVLALKHASGGEGLINGLQDIYHNSPERFEMILHKGHKYYDKLPGLSVIIGGMWIGNISYWGFSQYVTQKAFAAKSLKEAQRGTIFAGYIKILTPFIVILPGIIAFSINSEISPADKAYPWLLSTFIPVGFKGITIAALFAAIVSSLSSMANSTSTIFTMDIYTALRKKPMSDKHLVRIGRITSASALLIATLIAKPLLGNLDQAFQFIQEYSAYVNPVIVIIFGAGFFWRRCTSNAVLWATIATIPISFLIKVIWPDMPFMIREVYIFAVLVAIIVVISYLEKSAKASNLIKTEKGMFNTGLVFNVGALGIFGILTALYIIFW